MEVGGGGISQMGYRINSRYVLVVVVIFISIVGSIVFFKTTSPLSSTGITFYDADETKRGVEIVNSGFANISIQKVLVNGNEARKVELGASRTNHLVVGEGIEKVPYITFHNINELEVKPELTAEKLKELNEKDDNETIRHYGLRVIGNEVPEIITIEYKYLGILYSLDVDVQK